MSSTTYKTEYSKSGAASCKECHVKIDKGIHRVGACALDSKEHEITKWYHVACFKVPKKKGIEGGVEAFEGWETLNAADLENLKAALEAKPETKKRTKAEAGATDEAGPIEAKYKVMSVDILKKFLKANKQLLSGKKDELVERCVDGETLGALPMCPTCQKAPVKLAETSELSFVCPGYYDKDLLRFMKCKFKAETVERLPWISDLKDAPPATPPTSPKIKAEPLPQLRAEDFENLSPKEAAQKLTEEAEKRKLSVPKSTATREIGLVLMSTKSDNGWDPAAALVILEEKFPPEEDAPPSKVPENAALAAVFDEMSKLETDRMKGNAYKGAANTFRSLDYLITSGKAMAKPGPTKVTGIGKGIATLIDEFLTEGKVSKLEELRGAQ